jgi:ADP-ribosylglycohydrolase
MKNPTLDLLNLDEPGKIGYTYKTMGAGFYALWNGTDVEQIITELTMEAGDSDTNCAVAGALLGLKLGYSKLPKRWVKELVHREWLEGKASLLLKALGM